jgi:hypothetical protein
MFGSGIMADVEILPGEGVAVVRLGDSRRCCRKLPWEAPRRSRERVLYGGSPMLVISYAPDDTVELVGVPYAGSSAEDEVFVDGIQLTFRLMDDVVADLVVAGHHGSPFDIGFVFGAGFAIFSMSSLCPSDLHAGQPRDPEDERAVVEGVGIAPANYFSG